MSRKQSARLTPRKWVRLLVRQPPRGFYRRGAVYLNGRQMEIENFSRILLYDSSKLCVEMSGGRFTVYGDGMKICALAAHRITLSGKFLRTDWADE